MELTELEPVDVEKVRNENPQSRFRVLDTALLTPGVCALCGSAGGDGRQFIDFGKTVDFFGCVYFCTFCVAEAAVLIGLGNLSGLEAELAQCVEAIQRFGTENAGLQEKLHATMVLVRNCTCTDSGIGVPDVELPEAELIEPESPVVVDVTSDLPEPDFDELAFEQGPDDVSADPDSYVEPTPTPRSRSRKSPR